MFVLCTYVDNTHTHTYIHTHRHETYTYTRIREEIKLISFVLDERRVLANRESISTPHAISFERKWSFFATNLDSLRSKHQVHHRFASYLRTDRSRVRVENWLRFVARTPRDIVKREITTLINFSVKNNFDRFASGKKRVDSNGMQIGSTETARSRRSSCFLPTNCLVPIFASRIESATPFQRAP